MGGAAGSGCPWAPGEGCRLPGVGKRPGRSSALSSARDHHVVAAAREAPYPQGLMTEPMVRVSFLLIGKRALRILGAVVDTVFRVSFQGRCVRFSNSTDNRTSLGH